jgi:hypothetical protein
MFPLTERDYVWAMRAHYASRLRLWLDIPAIVVAGIAGCYLWHSPNQHWLNIVLIGASGLLSLMLVVAFFVIPPLAFRREPKFRDEYSLTFSQESIHFKTEHVDSVIQWSMYSRALIDAHSYVLYYGTGSITVIPKRAFQDVDQQKAFEQLLVQHVPKIIPKLS